MTDVIFYSSNSWIYLLVSVAILFIMFKYKQDFNIKDLINSMIYLTHKVGLFFLFLTFFLAFIYSIVEFPNDKITAFFGEVMRGMMYYWFFSYGIFFGVKLIYWFKDFYARNDLFTYAFFDDKIKKEINKK